MSGVIPVVDRQVQGALTMRIFAPVDFASHQILLEGYLLFLDYSALILF